MTASTRRTPAATPDSLKILNKPMSPDRSTCVPPQSSIEKSPIESTRTSLSYFSPNNDIAPAATASSSAITRVSAGRIVANHRIHEFLDLAQFLGRQRLRVRKIETQSIGGDQRTLLLDMQSPAPFSTPRAASASPND